MGKHPLEKEFSVSATRKEMEQIAGDEFEVAITDNNNWTLVEA